MLAKAGRCCSLWTELRLTWPRHTTHNAGTSEVRKNRVDVAAARSRVACGCNALENHGQHMLNVWRSSRCVLTSPGFARPPRSRGLPLARGLRLCAEPLNCPLKSCFLRVWFDADASVTQRSGPAASSADDRLLCAARFRPSLADVGRRCPESGRKRTKFG